VKNTEEKEERLRRRNEHDRLKREWEAPEERFINNLVPHR